jgi:hypothetical protein
MDAADSSQWWQGRLVAATALCAPAAQLIFRQRVEGVWTPMSTSPTLATDPG